MALVWTHHSLSVDLHDFVSGVNPLGFICRRLENSFPPLEVEPGRFAAQSRSLTHTHVLRGSRDDVKSVVRGFDVNALNVTHVRSVRWFLCRASVYLRETRIDRVCADPSSPVLPRASRR